MDMARSLRGRFSNAGDSSGRPVPVAGRPVVVMVTETVTLLSTTESAASEPVSPFAASSRATVEVTARWAATGSTRRTPARAESASSACAPARAAWNAIATALVRSSSD